MLGAPLGSYVVFLDFVDSNGQRRPEAQTNVLWSLERDDVLALIREASKFSGVRGERSEPLKLLRFYLTDIQSYLVDTKFGFKPDETAALKLLEELRVAAILKGLAKNGTSILFISESAPGKWTIAPEWMRPMEPVKVAEIVKAFATARKHAGVLTKLEIAPSAQTTIGSVRALARSLAPTGELDSTRMLIGDPPLRVRLTADPGANVLVAFGAGGKVDYAIKPRDTGNMIARFSTQDAAAFPTTAHASGTAVEFRDAVLKTYKGPEVVAQILVNDDDQLKSINAAALDGFGDVAISIDSK